MWSKWKIIKWLRGKPNPINNPDSDALWIILGIIAVAIIVYLSYA